MNKISWEDFEKIELRVGTIISVNDFPEARNPAYILNIDFGKEIGVLKSSAQITELYDTLSLIGKQIIGVVNFPPKQIGPHKSECLITGFYNEDKAVVLAVPDKPLKNGKKLS